MEITKEQYHQARKDRSEAQAIIDKYVEQQQEIVLGNRLNVSVEDLTFSAWVVEFYNSFVVSVLFDEKEILRFEEFYGKIYYSDRDRSYPVDEAVDKSFKAMKRKGYKNLEFSAWEKELAPLLEDVLKKSKG